METISDRSYGIIPTIQEDGVWKIFLINQYGHGGDIYWTFPKGHAEEGETPKDAALRELKEETGLTVAQLYEERMYTHSYAFMSEGVRIEKEVVFYRALVSDTTFTVQKDEVKEAGWFTFEDALTKLTFEGSKAMLREMLEALQ